MTGFVAPLTEDPCEHLSERRAVSAGIGSPGTAFEPTEHDVVSGLVVLMALSAD